MSESIASNPPPYPKPRLSDEEALEAKMIGKELNVSDGVCKSNVVSRLAGKCYDVYLIQVRYKGKLWVVRKRFREISELNHDVEDAELKAIFPPKSLCAKVGLTCAVETRQSRLSCYLQELTHKIINEPSKHKILEFLDALPSPKQATRALTPVIDITDGNNHLAVTRAGTMRKNNNPLDKLGGKGGGQSKGVADLNPQAKEAYSRLFQRLINGVMLIKHCRRGGPKRRLIFCNEDFSILYWASDRRKANLSHMSVKEIINIREASEPDPASPGDYGTAILRKKSITRRLSLSSSCNEYDGKLTFSIITASRSLDLQALNDKDHAILLQGFRAVAILSSYEREKEEAAASASPPSSSLLDSTPCVEVSEASLPSCA